ncbi:MAG: hypothetical protein LQ352_004958 [Teloschistes flavicans]|nr:MAG: hypothetical protein LQ352_004958 [Teloschistes flavicans]
MKVHCTPNTTVESLSMYSCNNAWHKIVRSVTPVIYSQRPGTGKAGDVSLPVRYLSDDGRCAIDINVASGKHGDVATGLGIARAASEIFRTCLPWQPTPQQSMSGEATGFSPLPLACRVFVDLYHPNMYKTVEGKWYDIWAAGVAINEVCVKRSQIGIVGPISTNGASSRFDLTESSPIPIVTDAMARLKPADGSNLDKPLRRLFIGFNHDATPPPPSSGIKAASTHAGQDGQQS